MVMRISQFANLVSKITDKYHTETTEAYPSQINTIAGPYPYDGKSETIDISGSTQLPMAPDHKGRVNEDQLYERGSKQHLIKWVSQGVPYEYKLWQFQQFQVINDRAENLIMSVEDAKEYFVMAFLGYGHTTTHPDGRDLTGFDGVAPFSASHVLADIVGCPTQSNLFTTTNVGSDMTLSPDNVKYIRRQMALYKNDRNQLQKVQPNTLIVPLSLADDAEEIMKSEKIAHELSNTTNILRDVKVVVIPELDQFSTVDYYFANLKMLRKHFIFVDVYKKHSKTSGKIINGIRVERDYDVHTKAEFAAADGMYFCGFGLEWRMISKIRPGV